jgi:hypothetical protein
MWRNCLALATRSSAGFPNYHANRTRAALQILGASVADRDHICCSNASLSSRVSSATCLCRLTAEEMHGLWRIAAQSRALSPEAQDKAS